jgi:hypothetical protein
MHIIKTLGIRRFCVKIKVSRRCWDIFCNSKTNTEKRIAASIFKADIDEGIRFF